MKKNNQIPLKSIVFLVLTLLLDLATSAVLYLIMHDWKDLDFDVSSIKETTVDVVLISLFRVVSIPVLLIVAKKIGSPNDAVERANEKKTGMRVFTGLEGVLDSEDSGVLLEESVGELTKEEELMVKKGAKGKKKIVLTISFILFTAAQVYVGVKSVVFNFPVEDQMSYDVTAVCYAVLVAVINIEMYFCRSMINITTKDNGFFFPKLHSHPIFYTDKIDGHWCDLCRSRIQKFGYRCNSCDFDMCLRCFSRQNNASAEGMIRGDKGIREEEEISNFEHFKTGMGFAKNYWSLIIVAIIFLILNSGTSLLIPNYQGSILDYVIANDKEGFGKAIITYVILSGVTGLFGAIRNLCFNLVGQRMSNSIRNKLYSSIILQDIAFFDGFSSGDLTSRLTSDTNAMIAPINTMLSTTISAFFSLLGGLFMCLYTSWRLSILAFTTIGPVTLMVRIYSKWSRYISKQIWASLGEANGFATQSIGNIRTVRAFGMEDLEESKYHEATKKAMDLGIKDAFTSSGTFTFTSYLDKAISVLILWYGGSMVLQDADILTVGDLITFQLYWNMINVSFDTLTNVISSYTRAGGAAQRVMTIMNCYPDIDPSSGRKLKTSEINGDIDLVDVHFHYQMRPENKVLKGINLSIKAGQVCALVGRSGGGKSTLIHLLMRFYDPKQGELLLDSEPFESINPVSLRKNIGIVAQDTQLFNLTIEENIAYGVEHYTRDELITAAQLANAHDFIESFEEGYMTRVGERGVRLSGGQKQRIAIARVLLRKPKLLFLDEATSSLDAESESLVQEAIDNLIEMGGMTVVLVAHRLSTVINADKIAVVDQGKILESGNHEELLHHGGLYAKLVEKQIRKMQNTLEEGEENTHLDIIDNLV